MTESRRPPRDAQEEFEEMVKHSGFPPAVARRKIAQAIVAGTFAPVLIFSAELQQIALRELVGGRIDE